MVTRLSAMSDADAAPLPVSLIMATSFDFASSANAAAMRASRSACAIAMVFTDGST